ncbi:hypothetical protein GCM10022252_75220 [Streptosporangium oxazolinicum]|uniref:Uncharacterized protein n=1 Tax=Streptosporangium oxazolinicum TaxID=909287 RepID=A0ABP8BKN8_9ACTN
MTSITPPLTGVAPHTLPSAVPSGGQQELLGHAAVSAAPSVSLRCNGRDRPPDQALGIVRASNALDRLRGRLREYGLYPAVTYHGGDPEMHLGNDAIVHLKVTEEGLSYHWSLMRRGQGREKHKAPATEIDAVAGQIAAALGRLPDEQLTP